MAKKTPQKLGKYESLHQKYMTKMSSLFSSRAGNDVYAQISNGRNTYLKYERTESSSFDMEWIKEIEDAIYDLGEIVKNPKKTTKTEETIVPAELARKTNATSVRHLASHTQFIKEIDERGNVTPSKILNIGAEDDYATYENRFVATLIRRLVLFIEKRYEYINEFAELKDAEVLMVKSKSMVDGKEVEIETKVKILSDNDVTGTGQSSTYIQRIKEVRRYVRFYYNSPFMKILKNERDVRSPILQTNIIRKNPLYRRAYKLFKFIETYDTLGVNFKINEKYSDFSEKEMEDLNATLLANFLAVKGKDPDANVIKEKEKEYKPKVLKSIDEEQFTYGDILKGPIEFVRVDDTYLEYLAQQEIDVPEKPKKEELEYYKEELEARKEKKRILKAEKALISRKKKEEKEWNKKAEKIVAQRIKEEQEAIRREEEARRQAELSRIAAAREELKQEAKSDKHEVVETAPEVVEKDLLQDALKALSDQGAEDANEVLDEKEQINEEPAQEQEDTLEETPIEEIQEEPNEIVTEEENIVEEEAQIEEQENLSSQDEQVDESSEEELVSEEEQINEEIVPEIQENTDNNDVIEENVDNKDEEQIKE